MYSYRFDVQHSSIMFEVSAVCLDTFSDSCDHCPCHHGMAHPEIVDDGTASDMEDSCEGIE